MRKISLIVIHCSATRVDRDFTAKDVDTAHRFRGFSCWGYHYYIRKSGQIEPMRDEDTVGAHARGFNAISLGVCYEGGLDENGKAEDIELNVCKTKHLTNTRSSSADDALKLIPPKKLSLEEALEFIDTDELLEITPENLRIRKKILDSTLRFRSKKNAK